MKSPGDITIQLIREYVEKLIKACDETRDKALILLMVDTGLRREEILSLDWEDVDITTGVARVERGKGQECRRRCENPVDRFL